MVNLKDRILIFFYDMVVYNLRVKRIILRLLRTRAVVENPLYKFFYSKEIQKKMAENDEVPFRVTIENTNACKSHCTFCPHDDMEREIGFMSDSLYKKIIKDCADSKIDFVSIFWFGEPLSDPKFIQKVRYAKEMGIKRVTTNTNLYFLKDERAEELVKSGLDEIFISVDAASPETYKRLRPGLNFEQVERNIKKISEIKKGKGTETPKIFLSYVESEINRDETQVFIDKWKDVVDGISISQIHNWTGSISHQKDDVYRKKEPCRLLWADMVISWDGNVPLCCLDYDNKVVLGNIKKNSIREIWGDEKIQKIRNHHKKYEFEKMLMCNSCEYNYHDKAPWWVSK